jgi:hypothetical protein
MKMTFFLRFDAFSQWISRHPQLVLEKWEQSLMQTIEILTVWKP